MDADNNPSSGADVVPPPYIVFIEKKPHCDEKLLKRTARALRAGGATDYNLVGVGTAGHSAYITILSGEEKRDLDKMRSALEEQLSYAAGRLSKIAKGTSITNHVIVRGVAGFAPVLLLNAPPPSSTFWEQLMPDIIKYSDGVQQLCDRFNGVVRIINGASSSDVVCRNGGVCAVTDRDLSREMCLAMTKYDWIEWKIRD